MFFHLACNWTDNFLYFVHIYYFWYIMLRFKATEEKWKKYEWVRKNFLLRIDKNNNNLKGVNYEYIIAIEKFDRWKNKEVTKLIILRWHRRKLSILRMKYFINITAKNMIYFTIIDEFWRKYLSIIHPNDNDSREKKLKLK